jgi:NTP pyrophosphatase (non-canonical NTP hydrolase)
MNRETFLAIQQELKNAREKFPNSTLSMNALVEEVGELAKALMDESASNVRAEAIQVAVMAIRVSEEGDSSFDTLRELRKLGKYSGERKCQYLGCEQPFIGGPCALCYE